MSVTDWLIPKYETLTSTTTLRSSAQRRNCTLATAQEITLSLVIWCDQTWHVPAVILNICLENQDHQLNVFFPSHRVCRPYLHGDHFPRTSRSMLVAQLYCCATGCTSYKPKEPDKSFSFRHFLIDQRLKRRWTAEHLEGYRAASNCSLSQEVVGWYDLIYN